MAKLDIYRGGQLVKRQTLPDSDLVLVGRTGGCDISLPDFHRRISRSHAVLLRFAGRSPEYMIRDLGSLHGTKVDGVPVTQRALKDGEAIEIADYRLVFSAQSLAASDFRHLRIAPQRRDREAGGGSTLTSMSTGVRDRVEFAPEKRELLEELHHRNARGEKLSDFAADTMPAILRLLDADKGFIGMFVPGEPGGHVELGIVNLGSQEEIEIADPHFGERLAVGEIIQEEGVLLVPVYRADQVHGFFCIAGKAGGKAFSGEEVSFLATLGRILLSNSPIPPPPTADTGQRSEICAWPIGMVGRNKAMREIWREIQRVGATQLNVLILGETGSGKELVARALHEQSPRSKGPFIARNCSQTTESLAESEIFGYVAKSGIAGADPLGAPGWFEQANHGTLFLDEIHRLTPAMQDKFLRVLQDKQVWRIGARSPLNLDLNLVAATDEDVERAVQEGLIRRPFRYRFGATIELPPLRARKDDVPLLAFYFLDKYASATASRTRSISHRALRKLAEWDWPGNVRKLEQLIELGVAKNQEVLFSWDFDLRSSSGQAHNEEPVRHTGGDAAARGGDDAPTPVPRTMDEVEREYIKEVLEVTQGNITKTAQVLGYKSRQTLLNKMDRFGIPRNYADPEMLGSSL